MISLLFINRIFPELKCELERHLFEKCILPLKIICISLVILCIEYHNFVNRQSYETFNSIE